jgi:hypothetical protein
MRVDQRGNDARFLPELLNGTLVGNLVQHLDRHPGTQMEMGCQVDLGKAPFTKQTLKAIVPELPPAMVFHCRLPFLRDSLFVLPPDSVTILHLYCQAACLPVKYH